MSTITLRNTILSSQEPKICNALMGETAESIIQEAKILGMLGADVFELRADFFGDITSREKTLEALFGLRKAAKDHPIVFAIRNEKSGSPKDYSYEERFAASVWAIESGCIDALEVETDNIAKSQDLIALAKEKGIATVIAAYDYSGTPSEKSLLKLLDECEKFDADIIKIATMANSKTDVLRLSGVMLSYTESHSDIPLVVVSMGKNGIVSRILPKFFNSIWTYASGITTTMEGQVNLDDLRSILNLTK